MDAEQKGLLTGLFFRAFVLKKFILRYNIG
jgi:hypothetical protein